MNTPIIHTTIHTNGVNLHVAQAGAEDGPLLIFLHGFPDFWYGWRAQIDYFAARGYRVWAPDQRGYNLSDKPLPVAAYTLDQTAADVVGLIQAARVEKAYVVGHDWGAAVTWRVGQKFPQVLHKMAVLNAPHNGVFRKYMRTHWRQLLRSWYIFYFQLPFLPQWGISRPNWLPLASALRGTANRGAFSDADLREYRQAWARTGDGSSMLAWYRAAAQVRTERLASPRVSVPTLIIWGAQDFALERALAPLSLEMCDEGRLEFIEDASHWVQRDAPDRVNTLLADFLI
ncbi:MAG: alpha/beta hydrolase [Chloroflexi bacterium]|nr:alpha/beta hydrolase [Chloroflexota bacterium]